jgi:UDPglucose 6-dehydrogenase
MHKIRNVLIVGLWHQGVVAAACLADWGYNVTAIDSDSNKVMELNHANAPIFEPGLNDLLSQGIVSKRLIFSLGEPSIIKNAQVVLIAHDTPVDENDISDLSGVFEAVNFILPNLSDGVVIHITAQVPVGTCDEISELIKSKRPSLKFSLAYSPENLRLGQAINLYRTPMLPVIGSDDKHAFEVLKNFYSHASVDWQFSSLRTAEMLKHALNAFLALSITFANELGNLCDKIGVDGHRLGQLLRLEPRIGAKAMLMPGLGFSGGTLARDVQTLRGIGKAFSLDMLLLDSLWNVNQHQNKLVLRRLNEYFKGSLAGRKICVLGLTYKPDTSTLRRSAALEIIADLVAAGVEVTASDPLADRGELKSYKHFQFHESESDALIGADALLLVTPWSNYKNFSFIEAQKNMSGKLVFDTANLWQEAEITGVGMDYMNIGGGKLFGDKA